MNESKTFGSWESAVEWLREQPGQEDLVRAAYYDDPLRDASERYRKSTEWQAIREWLRGRSGSALDIGAGRGIATYALAREGFTVTALEPDPSQLVGAGAIRALARETGLPIAVVEESSERLPFLDGSFDIVFARAVLHHIADLDAACKEFYRVLKPGGLLVAVREHVISRKSDLKAFLQAHPLHHLYGRENAYLLDEYTDALRQARFTIRSTVGPFQSVVNYFPHTQDSLRQEVVGRLGGVAASRLLVRAALAPAGVFLGVLRLMSFADSRPGRLYSFLCDKQGAD